MTKQPLRYALIIAAALTFAWSSAQAQEDPPGLAEVWLVTPKAGHGKEFWEGMKKHMAFRAEQGDPWAWQAYTPLLGDRLSQVAVRTCCVNWADVDAYGEWGRDNEAVGEHFEKHVSEHVDRVEHYFESIDWDSSHWPAGERAFRYYAVTEFALAPGRTADFHAAREKMSQIALEQGWATGERNWLWMTRVGGPPAISIVLPHPDLGSLDRGEDSFFRFLSEKLGSEEAAAQLFADFDGSTTGSHFQIWERAESLSMKAAE